MSIVDFAKQKRDFQNVGLFFKNLFAKDIPVRNKISGFLYLYLLLVVFFSVFLQAPFAIDRGLNSITILLWGVYLLAVAFYQPKPFLRCLIRLFLLLIPFLASLLFSLMLGHNSFSSGLTRAVLIAFLVFLAGYCSKEVFSGKRFQGLAASYILAAAFLSIAIYFAYFQGFSFNSYGYAYASKNSASPLIFISLVLFFALIPKNFLTVSFFVPYLGLASYLLLAMKSRATLVCVPFVLVFGIVYSALSKKTKTILFLSGLALLIALVAIPPIRTLIFDKVLFAGWSGRDLDSLSSGRITYILAALENPSSYLLVGHDTYVDCMPVYALVQYGLFGFFGFSILFAYPFYVWMKAEKFNHTRIYYIYVLLLLYMLFNSFVEGYGLFGPVTKTFVFWFFAGYLRKNVMPVEIGRRIKPKEIIWQIEIGQSYSKATSFLQHSRRVEDRIVSRFSRRKLAIVLAFGMGTISSLLSLSIPVLRSRVSNLVYSYIPSSSRSMNAILPSQVDISGPQDDVLYVGVPFRFSVAITPLDAFNQTVVWDSWDTDALSIDKETGVCIPKKIRDVNVHCVCEGNPSITSVRRVFITERPSFVETMNISLEKETIDIGESLILSTEYSPCYSLPDLAFSSSDPSIASVATNGVIKGLSAGNVVISATASKKDGTLIYRYVSLCVSDEVYPEIQALETDLEGQLWVGDERIVEAKTEDGIRIPVLVETSDERVLEISNGKLFARAPGTANVVISYAGNTDISISKQIIIKEPLPTNLWLSKNGDSVFRMGQKYPLSAQVHLENGKDIVNPPNIRWTVDGGIIDRQAGTVVFTRAGNISVKASVVGQNGEQFRRSLTYRCISTSLEEYHLILDIGYGLLIASCSLLSGILCAIPVFEDFRRKNLFLGLALGIAPALFGLAGFLVFHSAPHLILVHMVAFACGFLMWIIPKKRTKKQQFNDDQ